MEEGGSEMGRSVRGVEGGGGGREMGRRVREVEEGW